jgi:hypothetical protein
MAPASGVYRINGMFPHGFSFPVGEAGLFPARPWRFNGLARKL